MIKLNKADMPGVLPNGKHIDVDITTGTAILVWKPQEITKSLLNLTIVHRDRVVEKRATIVVVDVFSSVSTS